MKKELGELINKAANLKIEMYYTLLQMIVSKGGFIKLLDETSTPAITVDSYTEDIGQKFITAIAVFDGEIYLSHEEDVSIESEEWYPLDSKHYFVMPTMCQLASELYYNNYEDE